VFSKMMQQAQQLQKKVQALQSKLNSLEIQGQAGGEAVKVVISGQGKLLKVHLVTQDLEADLLEDLIMAAYNDAWNQLEQIREQETQAMNIPAGLTGLLP
jgi:DNA-binding YbaB/EbfC family protein